MRSSGKPPSASASAHREGVVHRDIKPSNLLLARDGVVKVLDLGLARLWGDHHQEGEDPTPSLQFVGSPPFVAPEQVSDDYPVTHRADLYSLGCTLYYLLSGHPPFSGPEYPTDRSKAQAHVQRPIPPIRGIRRRSPMPWPRYSTGCWPSAPMIVTTPRPRGRRAEAVRPRAASSAPRR